MILERAGWVFGQVEPYPRHACAAVERNLADQVQLTHQNAAFDHTAGLRDWRVLQGSVEMVKDDAEEGIDMACDPLQATENILDL